MFASFPALNYAAASAGDTGIIVPLYSYPGELWDELVRVINPDSGVGTAKDPNYDKQNVSFISYGVESIDESYIVNATQYVGYLFITDDTLPNPYDSLPPYLDDLVGIVGDANAS